MKTLIITGNDASAGCLKAACRADTIVGMGTRLIVGPPPDREAVMRIFGRVPGSTEGLKALCQNFDRVELWFDPDAESQLALALMLDYLRKDSQSIGNLTLVYPDVRLAEMMPESAISLRPPSEEVTNAHLELASQVWGAWQSSAPEDLASLLEEETSILPFVERTLLRLLDELPARNNGLAASELILLKLVGEEDTDSYRVLARYHREFWPGTYTGFDAGQLLDDLGHAEEPAILGLPPGPYDMALMEDETRRKLYSSSPLTLSPFGQRLLAGGADFAEGGPSPRWWGGTELTSRREWRWDAVTRKLHHLI
ncbi:MAG: hypothetical protein WCF20_13130 [Methylovirgula sp.]